jgi:hypothetical protein
MEYNLQKTIQPGLNYFLTVNQRYPHLTPFPGHTLVVPGVGNVISSPTFFVPLNSFANPTLLKKRVDFSHNQDGLGLEESKNESEAKTKVEEAHSSLVPETSGIITNKEQKMDPAVLEAFQHPSFKSKTVVLNSLKRQKNGNEVLSPPSKKQKIVHSHNFQFL